MATTVRAAATLAALSMLALAEPGSGQNITVPALLNGLEGGSGTSIPFGIGQPARVQYLYDVEDLPWRGPRMIQRLSLRADNSVPNSTTFAEKRFLFVSLLLSTTSVRAETSSSVYRDNYGTDAMVVLDNVPIVLPVQPAAPSVRAANIDFVLPIPWYYGLTPARPNAPPPENLLIELRIHSQPAGDYRLDNIGSCSIPNVAVGQLGVQCAPVGGSQLTLTPGQSMVAGASFTWSIGNAPPNAAMFLFLGVTATGALFGQPTLPLPMPLFDLAAPNAPNPALALLVPSISQSAPDCWVNVQPIDTLFTVANAGGTGSVTIALAPGRAFIGSSLYAQAVAHSQTANPLQLVTSLGQQSTVCGPLGVARVYTLGSDVATSGQRALGQGAVVEVH